MLKHTYSFVEKVLNWRLIGVDSIRWRRLSLDKARPSRPRRMIRRMMARLSSSVVPGNQIPCEYSRIRCRIESGSSNLARDNNSMALTALSRIAANNRRRTAARVAILNNWPIERPPQRGYLFFGGRRGATEIVDSAANAIILNQEAHHVGPAQTYGTLQRFVAQRGWIDAGHIEKQLDDVGVPCTSNGRLSVEEWPLRHGPVAVQSRPFD